MPFSSRVEFVTALAPDEVRERLKVCVAPPHASGLGRFAVEDYPVRGRVGDVSCVLEWRVSYGRGVQRVLALEYVARGSGSVLRGQFRLKMGELAGLGLLVLGLGFAVWRTLVDDSFAFRDGWIALGFLWACFALYLSLRFSRAPEDELAAFVEHMLDARQAGVTRESMPPISVSSRPGRMDLTVSHRFSNSCTEVYGAFVNADVAKRFLFATASGTMERAEIDARVGGAFVFRERRDGVEVLHTGHYLIVDRGRFLAFDFLVPTYLDSSATVTMRFMPVWEGCQVDLKCEGVLPEWAEASREGWVSMLDAADRVLSSG